MDRPVTEDLARYSFSLRRALLMQQAAFPDCLFFHLLSSFLKLPKSETLRKSFVQVNSEHMLLAAIPALAIYKYLKKTTSRPRPCKVHPHVTQKTASLDQFSFPSGHTLHAVCFTVQMAAHYPTLGWVLIPLTLTIAGSRVVLGLHYPTDVLAGAAIGLSLGLLGLSFA